jgi:hypothetical protein
MADSRIRVACFATQGSGSLDEDRIRALLEPLDPIPLPFDRTSKLRACLEIVRAVAVRRPDLVVVEGTGIAGGVAVLVCRALLRIPYVVSSGDAVGPYVRIVSPALAPVAALYERLLCRFCAGFIGWSPYLVGRALTFGAPRAMTAAGWARDEGAGRSREEVRAELGIPDSALVFGLVGSLGWSAAAGYCYGLELVRALRGAGRQDVRVLIVGDGDGRGRLEELAGPELGRRVLITGRVPREQVPSYLRAIDVASLPQSVDGVGSFRYTTKLTEYLAAGLPVVTGQIPLAYDLDQGWLWRLPGDAPWDDRYVSALAALMNRLTPAEVAERRSRIPPDEAAFSKPHQQQRVRDFLLDVVDARA